MAYEMKAGQGSLFNNDRKEKENQPDMRGKVMLPNGDVHWVSAWKKTTSANQPWLSLQVGDKVQQQVSSVPPLDAHNQAKGNAFVAEADDDIPF